MFANLLNGVTGLMLGAPQQADKNNFLISQDPSKDSQQNTLLILGFVAIFTIALVIGLIFAFKK